METKQYKFNLAERDKWGNPLVTCPVCKWEFKLDGIRKHIIRKCQAGDEAHRMWLKKHQWNTETPAVHK